VSGAEEELVGGNMTAVVRVGDTVRRTTGAWSPAVHELLVFLEDHGYPFSPRLLGVDEQNREVLSYLEGHACMYPLSEQARSDDLLAQVGAALGDLHTQTAFFELSEGMVWREPALVGMPHEVICHNDVSPYNVIVGSAGQVGFIDFDFAAPGSRTWDLANTAYRFVPLHDEDAVRRFGWPDSPDRAGRLDLLLDAYGHQVDRDELAAAVMTRVTWYRDQHLASGRPPDHLAAYEADLRWLASHLNGLLKSSC
jgi:Ser/Thr protein kinase RdoA (MazF antagonist)